MRKKIVAANWKMNMTQAESARFVESLLLDLGDELGLHGRVGQVARLQRDEHDERLTFELVGPTDGRGPARDHEDESQGGGPYRLDHETSA